MDIFGQMDILGQRDIFGHMHRFGQRDRGTHTQIQTKDKRDTCTDSDKGTGGHMHRFGQRDISLMN